MPACPPIPGYEPLRLLGWSCGEGGSIHLARKKEDDTLVALRAFSEGPPESQVEGLELQRRVSWREPFTSVGESGRAGESPATRGAPS